MDTNEPNSVDTSDTFTNSLSNSSDTFDSFQMFSTDSYDTSTNSLSNDSSNSCDSSSSTYSSDFTSSSDINYELVNSSDLDFSDSSTGSSSGEELFVNPNMEEYENILQSGNDSSIKCSCCHFYFPKVEIQTDGSNGELQNICNNCLQNGTIVRCHKCNNFVVEMLFGWKFYDRSVIKELCGEAYYCDQCFPQIIFKYTINPPHNIIIDIAISKDKENGIEEKYFFEYIAEKFGVSIDKILISGEKYRGNIYFPYKMKQNEMCFNVDINE